MDSKTNIYVLLKNLEAFIKAVPINPKSPNCRAWEKDRTEMRKALKDTYKKLVKQGSLEAYRWCGRIPLKQVYPGPVRMCGRVLQKDVFPDPVLSTPQVLPLGLPCHKVPQKMAREQFVPDRRLRSVRNKR
jgi:hypothetical protein